MTALRDSFDGLLLDLDGTLYRGQEVVPYAVAAIRDAVDARSLYITNNASRSAQDVANHLSDLGFPASPTDVITSAHAAAKLVASLVERGSRVLVVGTASFAEEIRAVGLEPVREFADEPHAVVQGHSPATCWSLLAEAALAIRAGALWVAANLDATLPTERGLLPGNGSMVAALRTATDREPRVAGKPCAPIFEDAVDRAGLSRPLVVGDRLDTDIAGACAAKIPSLYVMTGVSRPVDVLFADGSMRPSYLAADLRGLAAETDELRPGPQEGWRVTWEGRTIVVSATGDGTPTEVGALRAVADKLWGSTGRDARRLLIRGEQARRILQSWVRSEGVAPGREAHASVSVEFDD